MSAVSLVLKTAPVAVGRAICHLRPSLVSVAVRISRGQCVCTSVTLCLYSYFVDAYTC